MGIGMIPFCVWEVEIHCYTSCCCDKVPGCWGRCNAGESISKRLLQNGVEEVKIRDKAVGRICTHVEGLK